MLSFYDARQQVIDAVSAIDVEQIPLLDSVGRAIMTNVVADQPLPSFDNSAMDGYAVRACDCGDATCLPLDGYLPAGGKAEDRLQPGTAVKIMTGAPVPAGADAVVPFEQTEEKDGQVTILGKVKEGDHIRWRGEDFQPGDLLLTAGSVVRPAEVSLIASFGITTVSVCRPVRVAILSTGDELQEPGEERIPGRIIDSNSWALAAAIRETGAEAQLLGIARDDRDSLREKLKAGLEADVLVTSAGVSAGDRDYVREILDELGVEQQFWKVGIKPGKPTAFALRGTTPIFSLPGNPVSTMITFEEFVRPALLKMMGHTAFFKPMLNARLLKSVKKKPGRLQLLRVVVGTTERGELTVISAGDQNTGILRTLSAAQGIAYLAADAGNYSAGDVVPFHLLGSATQLGC
jgi:molybdopterin molybdotransferase